MMANLERFSKINSTVTVGLEPELVDVEVDAGSGIPSLIIVGLPGKAVEESKERVRLAIKNSGFSFPQKKIVVNLAPADVKKEGPIYDLPIAVGVLSAGGFIAQEKTAEMIFMGELSLDGAIKPVKGVIQAAILAKKLNFPLVIPFDNLAEASLIPKIKILAVKNIKELLDKLMDENFVFDETKKIVLKADEDFGDLDFANIVGQAQAKRAFEISASGGHNILLDGSPGGGKTLLSRAMVSILPPLNEQEALDLTKIYSVAGLLTADQPIVTRRPFRSPHHTTSSVAIIGGGSYPKPGEVSLAHRGVLFLDEFPEFPRSVLEALRQPLEDRVVTVSRAQATLKLPADFILVAAQNPCPCGYLGDPKHECNCPMNKIIAYKRRVSGPLLDRIDLHLKVGPLEKNPISSVSVAESSRIVAKRVTKAREIQEKRSLKLFKRSKLNSNLSKADLEKVAALRDDSRKFLEDAAESLGFSMRSLIKVWRVGRTIADLSGDDMISPSHIAEALGYRNQKEESYGI